MDLETENRIASILLREAEELKRKAEKEGIRAYLENKPTVRLRPNSRFLTATVRGVQQANKTVETNEMWKLRRAELEFDEKVKGRSREESSSGSRKSFGKRCTSVDENVTTTNRFSSSSQDREKRWRSEDDCDEGFRDESFLQSRVKRGRGSSGARMDEIFSCVPLEEESKTYDVGDRKLVVKKEKSRVLRGNETDSSSSSSSEDEVRERGRRKERKKKKVSKKYKLEKKKKDRKKRKYDRG